MDDTKASEKKGERRTEVGENAGGQNDGALS